jgi:FlgD Ig-like domain
VRRLPVAAFVALAIVTVAAFFFTQHLKVSTPLVTGDPMPHPATINPVSGGVCPYPSGANQRLKPTSFRSMRVSFYLLNRSDDVDVDIVTLDGELVDQIASDVHMIGGKHPVRRGFTWDGRTSSGKVAPDGTYEIKVVLLHQDRSVIISDASSGETRTVTVQTKPPAIRVTSVTGADGSRPAVIPALGGGYARIDYTGTGKLRPQIQIYRAGVTGRLQLVKTYFATTSSGTSLWDGTLRHKRPAPQGTYLVGLKLTDASCTTVRWPASLHPAPGSTAHAGVTVRYLAAQPPLTPVAAGSNATVEVDSRRHHYSWALRRVGSAKVLESGGSSSVALHVKLPGGGAGLYGLALRWGTHRTVVPLIADAGAPGSQSSSSGDTSPTSRASRGHVLVVLPALTWQGRNPVDDDGDGIPNTLESGEPVRLARPLLDVPPSGFGDEAALIAYLRTAHLRFDLTTDLALIDGTGPRPSNYSGVVLAGDERWLPQSLGAALSTYVQQGGRVLSLGIGSLQRTVTVHGGQALDPSRAHRVDFLDARPLPVKRTHGQLLLSQQDKLGIFRSGANALSGYRTYQPFGSLQPPAHLLSAAGVSNRSPAVIGYGLGRGLVVDIGLPGFGSSLAHAVQARELLGRVWSLLSK